MSTAQQPRRRRWIGWTIGTLVTLAILSTGWIAVRGLGTVDDLQKVADHGAQLRTAVGQGDLDEARRIAPRIAQHAASAHALTSDPVWRAFQLLPWLGPNLSAVATVSSLADEIAAEAVTPVLDAASGLDLDGFGFTGSSIDLSPIAAVEAPLARAAAVLSRADTRVRQIDADATVAPLAAAVEKLRETIAETSTVVGTLHGAAQLLPSMLGQQGPRTYVVAMQNNAELRSDGGIVGALALVRAEAGKISIVRQASTRDFPPRTDALPLSTGAMALFGEGPGLHVQNVTSIPDFGEAGPILAARWQERFGESVDGVIAVDAVVAAHLVEATGPITFGPFTVDAASVVDVLLSQVYATLPDPAMQDAVFEQAAAVLLSTALHTGEPRALLAALAASSEEGRIRIWSAHPGEQAVLDASSLGGSLPRDDASGPFVGVLVNDATGAKMDYYTRARIDTAVGTCAGEPTTRVRVTWTNSAPPDAASTLPDYVTGGGYYGVEPGSVRSLVAVFGPEGAQPRHIDRDGRRDTVQTALLGTRTAIQHTVLLAPGESSTITVDFTGPGTGERLTRLHHTPLISPPARTHDNSVDCATAEQPAP